MVAVPAATPVTKPAPLTVAIVVGLELHVPPAVTSVTEIEEPTQTFPVAPVIVPALQLTVMITSPVAPVGAPTVVAIQL